MKQRDISQFQKDLEAFHITLTEKQIEQFLTYYELLIDKNKVMNLTAITEFQEALKKHFVDSLSLVTVFELKSELSLLDVGTGAGFPGIPLKIAFPSLRVTLLDSLRKRVDFLQEVIDALSLDNTEALHGRAEDFAKPDMLRERFDICVSRAVANLSTLSEYCLPYAKIGGSFVSYKTDDTEVEKANHAIQILGGVVREQMAFTLPSSDISRNLIVIEKCRPTPGQYPRKAGTANKKPII